MRKNRSRQIASSPIPLFSRALITAAVGLFLAAGSHARAAVVFDGTLADKGSFYQPLGAAADKRGDVYVADTGHHRIIKFDDNGEMLLKFGKVGSGKGQLYYPGGVAVGTDASGRTLVFVADTANNRIAVFTEQGNFVRNFGTYGSEKGQFNYPSGIAFIPDKSGPGGTLVVTDTRNGRASILTQNGTELVSSTCSDCPNGPFAVPMGVGVRSDNGLTEIYVTDEAAGRAYVLDRNLFYLRGFGKKGTNEGDLAFPDEVVIAKDGSSYVADSGSGADRVSAFSAEGAFLFSFSTTGKDGFVQPHGITLDQDDNLYVVNSGASTVHKFKLETPRLYAAHGSRNQWKSTSSALFLVAYNGVEQVCEVTGTAKITAPANGGHSFTLKARLQGVASSSKKLQMKMNSGQIALIKETWGKDKQIGVEATFTGRCEDGTVLKPVKKVFKL